MFRSVTKVKRYSISSLVKYSKPTGCTVKNTRFNSSLSFNRREDTYEDFIATLKSKDASSSKKNSSIIDVVSESTWSSPYDNVYRQPFAKDTMHLLSLLEACLANKNFGRASNILTALYPISQKSNNESASFIHSLNKYIYEWSSQPHIKFEELEDFVKSIRIRFPDIQINDKTEAILLAKYMSTAPGKEDGSFIKFISKYRLMSDRKVKDVLSHIDVIGLENLKEIFSHPYIKQEDIPKELLDLYTSLQKTSNPSPETSEPNESEVPEYFSSENLPPSLGKNEKTLVSVDSFGLKVIRHTLLGLAQNNEKISKKFVEKLKLEKNTIIDSDNKIDALTNEDNADFHSIYKTLDMKDRQAFDEALEEYNLERQRQIELRAVVGAREKWKHDFEELQKRGDLSLDNKLNVHLWRWYTDLLPFVEEEIRRCKEIADTPRAKVPDITEEERKQNKDRAEYGPYMVLVDPKKMAVITILELLKLNSTGGIHEGMRTARAVIAVGKAIELEFRSEELLKSENNTFHNRSMKKLKSNVPELKRVLTRTRSKFRNDQIEDSQIEWPQEIRAKVGSVLVSLLLHVAKVPVKGVDPTNGEEVFAEQPAFYHSYQYQNGTRLGVLKIHTSLVTQLSGDKLIGAVQPQLLPMLVKPREWTSYNNGGYLYSQHLLIRSRDSPEITAYLKAASDSSDLNKVYEGLNVLGRTAWAINKRLFKIITEVWNSGEKYLDIPSNSKEAEYPPAPPRDAEPLVRRKWQIDMKKIANEFSAGRSLRCDANYKLEIARAFIGEKLYFPHNVDFRGRSYPLSPHFNHLGNDMTRSLLIFWEGKELGEEGLKWLKIHLANLFGHDKKPFNERIAFVEDHVADIMESANDPLKGKGWWRTADKPWQALSTIIELSEALQLEDPTKYISHQPVHQDGTCNGLQHYAALGGDIEGANQVNLVPNEKPQDVYEFVANLVRIKVAEDAANGIEEGKKLKDHIKRKVVKQTVMTNVYGVTYIGATAQIEKQLVPIFGKEEAYSLSRYLTRHVFQCIRELFHGAHLIQDWLGECAKRITKSVKLDVTDSVSKSTVNYMSSVIWTTPLGLPCVQPYRDVGRKQVYTNLQTVFISDPFSVKPVDSRKQQAGFPPNFIHSLDATHMLLSAVKCGEANLSFAAVHDSYWTHASDVNTMNEIIRNEFAKLHEVDLIESIKNEFEQRYRGFLQVSKIDRSTDVAKKITDFRKKISRDLGRSMTSADELYFEHRRQELLNSDDPKKQKQGKEMVTTVSLIENENIDSLLYTCKDNENRKSNLITIFTPLKIPDVPAKGDFDVAVVKSSPYFFS